jgi:hypothetical protein
VPIEADGLSTVLGNARQLVHESLETLPGHQGFLDFATAIDAPMPPRAHQIAQERAHFATLVEAAGNSG